MGANFWFDCLSNAVFFDMLINGVGCEKIISMLKWM